jgi:transcriptional regulator with XRE-family HTH domain
VAENIESPIKKLRLALGWSQVQLAQAIGRSYASVQGYEAGKHVPGEVVERMKSIAVERGLADVAVELSSEEWQVRRVFQPGEVLISQAREALRSKPVPEPLPGPGQPVRQPASGSSGGLREHWHRLLDEILDSGDPDAISTIGRNLETFAGFVRRSAAPPKKDRRIRP